MNATEKTHNITHEFSHDTREGWAVSEYYIDGEIAASNDGSYTTFHAVRGMTKDEVEEYMHEYFAQNGKSDPDWDDYHDALTEDQAEWLRDEYGDNFILIKNSYESDNDPGFGNTYYIVDADEGDKSRGGWEKAQKLSELGNGWDSEIVGWATEKGLLSNWF